MKALSFIALLIALAVVFMLQEKTVETAVVKQPSGETAIAQIEHQVNTQMQDRVRQLQQLEQQQSE